MKITVSGNKEPFQLSERIEIVNIELLAKRNIDGFFSFRLKYDDFQINIPTSSDFYQIAESIKGKYALDIAFSLSRLLPQDTQFSNSFLSKNQTETSIFKSLFLIFPWVEIALFDAYAVGMGSKIYNEFIIDTNNIQGNQADIYFLKSERITDKNLLYIERLIELNLLVKASFTDEVVGNYTTYFIPLLKPGVSRHFFSNQRDVEGVRTYMFWKEILDDRDRRIKFWMKNRF